jgi:hypothetical protein
MERCHKKHKHFCVSKIIHAANIINEFTPSVYSFTVRKVLHPHSAKLCSPQQGTGPDKPSGCNKLNQACHATTHAVKRCWDVSYS